VKERIEKFFCFWEATSRVKLSPQLLCCAARSSRRGAPKPAADPELNDDIPWA